MTCPQCGTALSGKEDICPVCAAKVKNQSHSSAARLILGGAALLLVCLCAFIGYLLQSKDATRLHETAPETSLTLADPDGEQAALPTPTESCVFTNAQNMPLGTYTRLSMTAKELEAMDSDAFAALWDSFAATEGLYVTICLDDGCGLVFSKGNRTTATYGTLDENSYIDDVRGLVLQREDGTFIYSPNETSSEASAPAQQIANAIPTADDAAQPAVSPAPPKDATTSAATTVSSASAARNTVYITASGTKYHRAECSYLHDSKISISASEARARGYSPCSRCNP